MVLTCPLTGSYTREHLGDRDPIFAWRVFRPLESPKPRIFCAAQEVIHHSQYLFGSPRRVFKLAVRMVRAAAGREQEGGGKPSEV